LEGVRVLSLYDLDGEYIGSSDLEDSPPDFLETHRRYNRRISQGTQSIVTLCSNEEILVVADGFPAGFFVGVLGVVLVE